jgi:hypothetical protein
MKLVRNKFRLIAVAVSCVAIGAAISAIATAGAATSSTGSGTKSAGRHARQTALRVLRRSVHGDLVVATKNGLVTVTFDRGKVQSVSGRQLTIDEGTKTKTLKVVTLTVPSNARVRNNGRVTSLAMVKAGHRVLVVQGPKVWHVIARTPRNP